MKKTAIVLALHAVFIAAAAYADDVPLNQNIPGCGQNSPNGQEGQYAKPSKGKCFDVTSSVHLSIYGIADVGVASVSVADANTNSPNARPAAATGVTAGKVTESFVTSGQSSGSRLGFSGSGRVQDGLNAVFVAEQRMEYDTGGNGNPSFDAPVTGTGTGLRMWDRQIYAGLVSEKLGALTIGRQYTPRAELNSMTDGLNGAYTAAPNNIGFPNSTNRMSNSIKYVSPLLSGFTARLQYAPSGSTLSAVGAGTNESAPNTTANTPTSASNTVSKTGDKGISLGISWETPQMIIAYSYLQTYAAVGSGNPALAGQTQRSTAAAPIYVNNVAVDGLSGYGATAGNVTSINPAYSSGDAFERYNTFNFTYDFGVAKVHGLYSMVRNLVSSNFVLGSYAGATTAAAGASNALTARGDRNLLSLGVTVPLGAHKVFAGYSQFKDKGQLHQDGNQFTLIYEYLFDDRRTTLYALASQLSDKNSATWGFGSAGSASSSLSTIGGQSGSYLGAGMKYVF